MILACPVSLQLQSHSTNPWVPWGAPRRQGAAAGCGACGRVPRQSSPRPRFLTDEHSSCTLCPHNCALSCRPSPLQARARLEGPYLSGGWVHRTARTRFAHALPVSAARAAAHCVFRVSFPLAVVLPAAGGGRVATWAIGLVLLRNAGAAPRANASPWAHAPRWHSC